MISVQIAFVIILIALPSATIYTFFSTCFLRMQSRIDSSSPSTTYCGCECMLLVYNLDHLKLFACSAQKKKTIQTATNAPYFNGCFSDTNIKPSSKNTAQKTLADNTQRRVANHRKITKKKIRHTELSDPKRFFCAFFLCDKNEQGDRIPTMKTRVFKPQFPRYWRRFVFNLNPFFCIFLKNAQIITIHIIAQWK